MAANIKIAIGSDHGGYALKEIIRSYLEFGGYAVIDAGPANEEPCDYPEFGYKAALAVSEGRADRGIVICKSGFGMCIVANKVKGVRCATCDTVPEAESARKHNDCNMLSLGANRVSPEEAKKITDTFIKTAAEGGRHSRRVEQIRNLENNGEIS